MKYIFYKQIQEFQYLVMSLFIDSGEDHVLSMVRFNPSIEQQK